jgi:HNH endonuclease
MPSFRERPEYIAWKEAVFRRFGRQCVLCGHSGNIHAHHIKPVKQFPEKAFDVDNGVPLCGNCHAEVNGREAEYEGRLIALQRGQSTSCPPNTEAQLAIERKMREEQETIDRKNREEAILRREEDMRRLYGDDWPA